MTAANIQTFDIGDSFEVGARERLELWGNAQIEAGIIAVAAIKNAALEKHDWHTQFVDANILSERGVVIARQHGENVCKLVVGMALCHGLRDFFLSAGSAS